MTEIYIKKPKIIDEEWTEYKSYYLSNAPQHSQRWTDLRRGALTMGMLSTCLGRSYFKTDPYKCAKIICGLDEKSFDPNKLNNKDIGISGEPIFRNWISEQIGTPIKQVGLGIWKQDPRFRGSLDGEINNYICVELKLPEKMYPQLVKHMKYIEKHGKSLYKNNYDHIPTSHLDQMQGNMLIHGKKYCDYYVYAYGENLLYYERIEIKYNHWNNILYPKAIEFYNKYVEPLIREHEIELIIPESEEE